MKKSIKILMGITTGVAMSFFTSLVMSLIMYKLDAPVWETAEWLKVWGMAFGFSFVVSGILSFTIPKLVRMAFTKKAKTIEKEEDTKVLAQPMLEVENASIE